MALHHHGVQGRLGGKVHLLQRPIAPFFQGECCHDRGLLPLRRGYCVQSLPSSPLPLDRPLACLVPTLHPAWGPPAMVGGITACAAGDALCEGLLEGPHRQMVTTCGDRCRHAGTAEGARGHVTPVIPENPNLLARGAHAAWL